MGICTSKAGKKLRVHRLYEQIPAGTEDLKNQILPMLVFEVLISDIEIKNCIYDQVSVKLKIQNLFQGEFPLKEVKQNQKVEWKINCTFSFQMTEYTLRQKFAVIEIHDKFKKLIGSQSINMYTIWTGPYHLDFKFDLPEDKFCRLQLNFKVSQGCHLKIENLITEIQPAEKVFPSELFTFCAEAIIGQQMDPSNYAYLVRIENPEDITNKNRKSKKSPIQTIETCNVTNDKIIWRAELAKELPLPIFDRNIAYYQIHASSLHFTFWKVRCGLSDNTETFYQMYSECFISMIKLLSYDYKIWKDPTNAISYTERMIDIDDKIWLHGKEVGTVRLKLKFTLQTHQKQMQACVMTQNGISTTSPVFNTEKVKQCVEIESLKKLNNQIEQEFVTLDQNQKKKNSLVVIGENKLRIRNLLVHEINLLKRSNKSTTLFYEYKDAMELSMAQRVFIDLAFRTVTYIHEEQSDIQRICWQILTIILKRGEFSLTNIGFDKSLKEKIANGDINEKLTYKINVGLKYQELLNYLIKETLVTLDIKGEQAESEFAEFFCSYAYFRIPLFRDHILSAIKRDNDPQIPEWQSTEFNLYENTSHVDSSDFYNHHFDWQNNLWKCLISQQKYKTSYSKLEATLLDSNWKQRFGKRKGIFFTFLSHFGMQIKNISAASKHIKWQCIPGYSRLLHAFLVEMTALKIGDYNDRFRKCCISLLGNLKLLNLFVMIVLKKSNLNDPRGVSIALQLIDQFFKQVRSRIHSFPTTFDYNFFFHGVRMVLDGQSQFNASQALVLLYNNFNYFGQEFSLELLLYLLSQPFFRFFFHWSYSLRSVFHIIIYVLVSTVKQNKESSNFNNNIQNDSATNITSGRISSYTLKEINDNLPNDRILNKQQRMTSFSQLGSFTNLNQDNNSQNDYLKSLKMAIVQRYDSIEKIIRKEIQPKASNTNEDCFHEKDLFRKMRFKFREKKQLKDMELPYPKNKRVNSQTEGLKYLPSLKLRSMRSLDNFTQVIVPKKCLYFSEEDIILQPIKPDALSYVGVALTEYAAVKQQFNKNILIDPNYWPEIKVKKILDEQELKPLNADEW